MTALQGLVDQALTELAGSGVPVPEREEAALDLTEIPEPDRLAEKPKRRAS